MEYSSYKTVEYSAAEQVHVIQPSNINGYGHLFGGQLVAWIDEVAQTVARRHVGGPVITASIDNLQFKRSASNNDLIFLRGKVTYIGRTSLEIRVDTYIEQWDGLRYPINRAYLTFVAIDKNEKPTPIKYGLTLSDETDRAEWKMAEQRKNFHKIRKTEGF